MSTLERKAIKALNNVRHLAYSIKTIENKNQVEDIIKQCDEVLIEYESREKRLGDKQE